MECQTEFQNDGKALRVLQLSATMKLLSLHKGWRQQRFDLVPFRVLQEARPAWG